MHNQKIAVVGGDRREAVLINELLRANYDLRIYGQPPIAVADPKCCSSSLTAALTDVAAIILPVAGLTEDGVVPSPYWGEKLRLTAEELRRSDETATIFCGVAPPSLRALAAEAGRDCLAVIDLDDFAIPNAIPTAEGALEIAMRETMRTMHGSAAAVLGFGRVGKAMAHLLRAVGATVTVFSRNAAEHRDGRAAGFDIRYYRALPHILPTLDMIFNTVPAPVLTAERIATISPDCLIVDLASKPGGVDFAAAEARKLRVVHALGLPGKCSPQTAGEILAAGYRQLLPRYGIGGR